MRNRFFYSAIAVIAVLAPGLISQAQTVPRSPEGKPDFSGFWSNPRGKSSTGPATVFTREKMAPFKPGGEVLFYEPSSAVLPYAAPGAFCASAAAFCPV